MHLLTFQCVLLAICFFVTGVQSIRWLAIKKPSTEVWNRTVCQSYHRRSKVLDRNQLKLCRRRLPYMKYVAEAVELTISECLKQTKYERWDCRSIVNGPRFSSDLRDGTRESAFVHALSSAALVFTITQGCSADNLKKCSCGKKPEKKRRRIKKGGTKWKWADCHDNIAYGIRFSKDFLDSPVVRQKKHLSKMMMNLHNNNVGRKVVRDSMQVRCRCHGLTGGCPYQTCTRELPVSFNEIALAIFKRYKRARQVYLEEAKDGKRILVLKRKEKGKNRNKKKRKPVDIKELIYLTRSRNFCKKDSKRKLPGTEGRECRRTSSDSNSGIKDKCNYLCCGRGHLTKKQTKKVDCRCKFKWEIMNVVCKKCTIEEEVSNCR